jgi:hypothetical protein
MQFNMIRVQESNDSCEDVNQPFPLVRDCRSEGGAIASATTELRYHKQNRDK